MMSRVNWAAKDKRERRVLRGLSRLLLDGLDLNSEGWREEACNRLRPR
jgi:hypothetical protein